LQRIFSFERFTFFATNSVQRAEKFSVIEIFMSSIFFSHRFEISKWSQFGIVMQQTKREVNRDGAEGERAPS
jgi:hypothetical protein